MLAKNRIRFKTSGLRVNHRSPLYVDVNRASFSLLAWLFSGICINIQSVTKAIMKVMRSAAITTSIPAKEKRAVASIGVKIEFND